MMPQATPALGGRNQKSAILAAGGSPSVGSGGAIAQPSCDFAPNPTPLRSLSSWEYQRSVLALTQQAVTTDLPSDTTADSPLAGYMDLNLEVFRFLFAEAEKQGCSTLSGSASRTSTKRGSTKRPTMACLLTPAGIRNGA